MSQRVSLGRICSHTIGTNINGTATGDESPEKKRQRENREKLEEKLDKIRSGWYNVRSRGQRGSDNFGSDDFGDLKMAGRKAAVSSGDFIRVYSAGCKAGKTNEEIAADLGMNPASVSSRASSLRKMLREKHGRELPTPVSKGRTVSGIADNADFLAALDGLDTVAEDAAE